MIKNIFQIWDENNRELPFMARRVNWPEECYVVVDRIECINLPYGKAFGYPFKEGIQTNHYEYDSKWRVEKLIPSCGSYQWIYVGPGSQ